MSTVSQIAEGVKNSVIKNPKVEEIAKQRLSICAVCPKNSKNKNEEYFSPGKYYSISRPDAHCTSCGCNLNLKARSLSASCPLKKWLSVLN